MRTSPLISVISPVYKGQETADALVRGILEYLGNLTENFEIILVDDGSPDESWKEIRHWTEKDKRIKGIRLSRNFGQHYAITAGLDHCKGEWTVVMDCDLQDQPSEIPNLYREALKENRDIVLARRHKRKDPLLKRFFSWLFHKLLGYLTGTMQDSRVGNFGIYHHKVIREICRMREQIRYFPTMVKWVGFRIAYLDVTHAARKQGKSNYSFRRLLSLTLDILLANSEKPIRLIVKTGLVISLVSFSAGLVILIRYLSGQTLASAGYTGMILSIWLLGGLIMMMLGVIGLYLGKTFENVKNRPIYIISEYQNLDEN